MKYIIIAFIKIYQKTLSPILGAGCRYYPSCSNYAVQAVKKHGAFKGTIMGVYRIVRCNRLSKGGFDSVPDNYRGDLKWVL